MEELLYITYKDSIGDLIFLRFLLLKRRKGHWYYLTASCYRKAEDWKNARGLAHHHIAEQMLESSSSDPQSIPSSSWLRSEQRCQWKMYVRSELGWPLQFYRFSASHRSPWRPDNRSLLHSINHMMEKGLQARGYLFPLSSCCKYPPNPVSRACRKPMAERKVPTSSVHLFCSHSMRQSELPSLVLPYFFSFQLFEI